MSTGSTSLLDRLGINTLYDFIAAPTPSDIDEMPILSEA
jgi:hypothetical protein